jgi:mono/diheme cytochrome c family protein
MWRIRDGAPETLMPAFRWLLKEPDYWDIATYVTELGSAK